MRNSAERIEFISDYIFSYEMKIKELNKQGLFDEAKLFELFAANVGSLYLDLSKPFINLNIEINTFPCVDLFSEDGNVFCQVSTCKDIPSKISKTFKTLKKSENQIVKSIKKIYFVVLNNESVEKVKDKKFGDIIFKKSDHLITTSKIIEKAKNDLDFQESLYTLLKKEDETFKTDFKKYQEAICYDSKVLLEDIDEYINGEYHIDLSSQIDKIDFAKNKFVLISGEAGSGKSVLCKKILENKNNVLCARAEKLVEKGDVNKVWNFNIKDTLHLVKDSVFIYIDALEFIADNINKLDVLNSLLERIKELDNTYFLCSCRSTDLNSFIRIISKYEINEYKVKIISDDILTDILKRFPVLLKISKNSKYNSLLDNPFYINFLTRLNDFNTIKDENQLRKRIWDDVVCVKDATIGPVITKIVLERATNFILYSDASKYEKSLIDKLVSAGVLIRNGNGIRLKYDIFEDICFEQYIDSIFDAIKGDYSSFFNKLENIGRCVYRRYQIWIENKLFSKNNRNKFLYKLISTDSITEFWRKQSLIGIIKSMYCQDFFDEYSLDITNSNLLREFIDITNVYGFEINDISFKIGTFILKNKGFGRECLIKLLYKNEVYKKDVSLANNIKKLIFDYTNSLSNETISKYSFAILEYYVDKAIEIGRSYDFIKSEVESIYKLHKVSSEWIVKFFKKLTTYFKCEDEDKFDFANDAIKDILSLNCACIFKDYTSNILEFYEIYYTNNKKEKKQFYYHYHDELNRNTLFGLNDNADSYEHESYNNNPKNFNVIFDLLRISFWKTYEWYLNFINKRILFYKEKNDIDLYKIYFSKDDIKGYMGTSEMWSVGECQNNMPALLSDMTFIVKSFIVNYLKSLKKNEQSDFANKIKKFTFEKTNNIIGLSIISNVGLTFFKELPGYCLELISSLELILEDLSRYSLMLDNPARRMLENEIAKKVGLPSLSMDKYKSINPNRELRNYAFLTQLYFPDLQMKFFEIFDYLYSCVKNDEEHALLYLQLQQMDIRNASLNVIDSQTNEVTSNIEGEAKNISAQADEINKSFSVNDAQMNEIVESLKNGTITVEKVDDFINFLLTNENSDLFFQFSNILIICISFSLKKLELSKAKRDEYCSLWLKYANKQINNEAIIIDANLYECLFEQLNEDISDINKKEIKNIILNLLIDRNCNDGTLYQIFNVAKKFLINNKNYGEMFLNVIFLLAEDEMNHQKYNYQYLCKYHEKELYEFIPNMQPRLSVADYYIEQEKRKKYDSKRNEIIKRYLFDEQKYEYSYTDISGYDIRIVSHAFSSGLNLKKEADKCFARDYIKQIIDIFNKNSHKVDDIIGYYDKIEVEEFFKECVLDKHLYSIALEILFTGVDFNKFTNDTIDFYLDITASLTAFYFDSFDSKEKRKHVENCIFLMEKYINLISNESIRNELSKALILGFPRYGWSGDWSKFKTNYEYSNKAFLNKMFSKYGYLHFYDLLVVISHLQYRKLLPELLGSLYVSFEKYVQSQKKSNDRMQQIISFIDQIMYYSFVTFESEIKKDDDLIFAFEGILSVLVELNDEKSAVLLDEFRVH